LLAGAAFPATAYGQCVTDSPAVDACRGGVRIARPAGATLDLSFMTPGTLDPRITFTRASTGTYFDSAGTMQTAAINAPRWDYAGGALNGLLIETGRTNLLLNSATLGTQGATATAVAHTLSFYGTGTINYSGAASGSLVGTGGGQRVSVTFTPSAGTLTCAVTGSVLNAQLEAGTYASSYIPTTSATVARSPDVCSMADATWFTPPGGSWFCEFIPVNPTPAASTRVVAPKGGTGTTPIFVNASKLVGQSDGASVLTANALVTGAVTKATTTWAAGQAKACLNGGAVALSASLVTGYATIAAQGTYFMGAFTVPADSTPGWLRRAAYWPRVLSDAEMQGVTA
jgi:hypothetical protein